MKTAKFFLVGFFFTLCLTNLSAQTKSSNDSKPSTEKSLGDRVKDGLSKEGVSFDKAPKDGGGSICKDVTRDVKACVDKYGANPKDGYGGSVRVKFD